MYEYSRSLPGPFIAVDVQIVCDTQVTYRN